tara:strand:- start:246 stop:1124 length:879 start_codon:yes stop_codon:yes gene_type:complete
MKDLTKKEARWILPAVIDNEASHEERVAFFDFIKSDPEVEKEYNDALLIKRAFSAASIRKKAPDHLKNVVLETIENLKKETEAGNEKSESTITPIQVSAQPTKWLRYLTAAAAVLFISLVTLQLLDLSTGTTPDNYDVIVENMAAEHFIKSGGQLIEPHFSTTLPHEAEAYLMDHFGMQITIPTLTGAEFAGIVMAEFVDDFQTPLLEYSQHSIGETIYLFAFDMTQVDQHKSLIRHGDAAEACIKSEDFYVAEINEHHVVSWLWENTWYAAISNHNGYDLAALVEPLNYSR